jgi:hypothetical protein
MSKQDSFASHAIESRGADRSISVGARVRPRPIVGKAVVDVRALLTGESAESGEEYGEVKGDSFLSHDPSKRDFAPGAQGEKITTMPGMPPESTRDLVAYN